MQAAEEAAAANGTARAASPPAEPAAGPRARKSLLDTVMEMKANPDTQKVFPIFISIKLIIYT